MRIIDRTAKKIIIEVTYDEINQKGFYIIWDEIRNLYSDKLYELEKIENQNNKKNIIIKLKLEK